MKKYIFLLAAMVMFVLLIGADIRRKESSKNTAATPRGNCIGFTIIEFGKAIDCHGDTVRLVRKNGVQVLAEN